MTITLSADHERIVQDQLRTGRYRSAEEVIDHALHTLRIHTLFGASAAARDPQAAAARIRERRTGVLLGGLKVKDLVSEGRR